MSAKISSASSALTGQNITETSVRNEQNAKNANALSAKPKKRLDESFELNLSETGQSMLSSALPAVGTPDEAKKQMALIKAAAEQSANSVLSSHMPTANSVIDLLA